MDATITPRTALSRGYSRARAILAALAATATLIGCASTQGGSAGGAGGSGPQPPVSVQAAELDADAGGGGVAVEPGSIAMVALLAPLSDERSAIQGLARGVVDSARLAETDIADPGLSVQVFDTAGTPEGARRAAEQAVAEGASLIVGPLFGTSVTAVAPIAEAAGVPVLAFSTDPRVAGGSVFLIGFLTATEVERVVLYAAEQGLLNLTAVAPRTLSGEIALRALQDASAGAGARIVATQTYVPSFEGIQLAVEEYAAFHTAQADLDAIQALLIPEQGQALQSVAAYLARGDVSPRETRFLGTGLWYSDQTPRELALRGGWFAGPDPVLRDQFERRFEAAYGAVPHPIASLGYDAVAAAGAMLADARASGDRFPFDVDAIVDPSGFAGVNGAFRFRLDGLNDRGLAILEVTADGFVVIDEAPTSFRDARVGF